MNRSNPQNDCFHKWNRVISDHLKAGGANVSEEMVKQIVLRKLGNTKEVLGEQIYMRSSQYKQHQADLTEADHRAGYIAMNELLEKMSAWAAMDLGLNLVDDEAAA